MGEPERQFAERMASIADEFKACRKTFAAVGDETRQHILIVLMENYGGMRVGDITARTNLSRPAVSHHLKILKEAGIVTLFKRGTMNFYHMDTNLAGWSQVADLMANVKELVQNIPPGCPGEE